MLDCRWAQIQRKKKEERTETGYEIWNQCFNMIQVCFFNNLYMGNNKVIIEGNKKFIPTHRIHHTMHQTNQNMMFNIKKKMSETQCKGNHIKQ